MKRLLSDAAITACSHAVAALSLIGIQVVLARSVSIREFGVLAATQAVVQVVEAALVGRGSDAAVQLLGACWNDDRAEVRRVAAGLLRYDIVASIGGYVVFAALTLLFSSQVGADPALALALGLAIPLQINYGTRRSLFVLNHAMRSQAAFEICAGLVLLGVVAPLAAQFGAWGFVAGVVTVTAFKNALVHVWTRNLGLTTRFDWRLPPDGAVLHLVHHSSMHAVARSLFSGGAAQADVLILGASGRPELVAMYRVAKTLASIPVRIAAPVWTVLRPYLLSAFRTSGAVVYPPIMLKVAVRFAAISVVGLGVFFVIGERLVTWFYGTEYSEAVGPLLVLLVGGCILGALTGWLTFVTVIAPRKRFGTGLVVAQLALVLIGGALVGHRSAMAMALVVAGTQALISVLAWWGLRAGRFGLRR